VKDLVRSHSSPGTIEPCEDPSKRLLILGLDHVGRQGILEYPSLRVLQDVNDVLFQIPVPQPTAEPPKVTEDR